MNVLLMSVILIYSMQYFKAIMMAGCIGKVGVCVQIYGWTVIWELAIGANDDNAYVKAVKILKLQLADKHVAIPL